MHSQLRQANAHQSLLLFGQFVGIKAFVLVLPLSSAPQYGTPPFPIQRLGSLHFIGRATALLRMSKLGAALDVFSPAFDPELALASPALSEQLGALFPRAQPLNNVSECRRLLPPSATDAVQTEHHLRAGSSHALAPKVVAPEARPGVDTRTAGAPSTAAAAEAGRQKLSAQWRAQFEEGPLSILSKLQRRRVRVVTRHEGGLRGWCEGQLLLCDRHFDMLLSDAIEHFVSPLDRQWQQRRSDQLLLRGDGVVSVCDLQSVAARDDRAAFGALILGLDEN